MKMSFERSYKEQLNLSKRIPLHYQKRYLANISNGSFNATFITGIYKNKVKTLLKTNKMLALALQSDRAKKEELLEESKANSNLIMFSKLNLACMSENLKKVVSSLDDTLALLELHSASGLLKFIPKNTCGREEFKEQIKTVLMDAIPEENKQSLYNEEEKRLTIEDMQVPATKIHGSFTNTSKLLEKNVPKKKTTNTKSSKKRANTELNDSSFKEKHISSRIQKKKAINKVNNSKGALNKNQSGTKKEKIIKTPNETKQCLAEVKEKKKGRKNKNLETERCDIFQLEQNNIAEKLYKDKVSVFQNIEVLDSLNHSLIKTPVKTASLVTHSENDVNSYKMFPYIDLDLNKENNLSNISKIAMENLKLFPESATVLARTKKASASHSALKNLSSKMNVENLVLERKQLHANLSSSNNLNRNGVASQVNSKKSTTKRNLQQNKTLAKDILLETGANEKISGDQFPNSHLISSYQPQDIIKNLARNTVLTTAEIHQTLERENLVKNIPSTFDKYCEPVVVLQDIFKVNKSFCKSISSSSRSEPNIPLELQLLQHCSSLKIIPEEPDRSNSKDDSDVSKPVEPDLGKKPNSKKIVAEPSLLVEGEIKDDFSNLEKRTLRKRSTMTYKEPSLIVKMRK